MPWTLDTSARPQLRPRGQLAFLTATPVTPPKRAETREAAELRDAMAKLEVAEISMQQAAEENEERFRQLEVNLTHLSQSLAQLNAKFAEFLNTQTTTQAMLQRICACLPQMAIAAGGEAATESLGMLPITDPRHPQYVP